MPTLTITLTAQQATRLQEAFAASTAIPNPTISDVENSLRNHLKGMVEGYELKVARDALSATPFDPT